MASLNFEFNFIEQKFASEFSFNHYLGRESERDSSAFIVQYIYCWPAFFLTNVWWSAIGTNIAVISLFYAYLARYNPQLALFAFSPALVNFSMFSLRDPLIMVVLFSLATTVSEQRLPKRFMQQFVRSLPLFWMRPENILIVISANACNLFLEYRKTLWVFLFTPFLWVVLFFVLKAMPSVLGLDFSGNITDLPVLLNDFYQKRAALWDSSDGGGSNILGGNLPDLPFVIRYGLQVVSMFVMPLPIDFDRLMYIPVMLDSLVFMTLCYKFHKKADIKVIVLFWVYLLVVALFMNNYGNAFRMRIPAYAILLGGLFRK
jgi:hypothetical protein